MNINNQNDNFIKEIRLLNKSRQIIQEELNKERRKVIEIEEESKKKDIEIERLKSNIKELKLQLNVSESKRKRNEKIMKIQMNKKEFEGKKYLKTNRNKVEYDLKSSVSKYEKRIEVLERIIESLGHKFMFDSSILLSCNEIIDGYEDSLVDIFLKNVSSVNKENEGEEGKTDL
ncbi:hypothetical protein CWI38_0564p0010 [Hamiltosporidium tvaerminnensis]|uniref:Uncharacterized protein n=2 Tax=Hamiltosporidium TaxID=1176354 RepID=A0A4Q9LQJ6_9MICR|nr:hypothetical protein CWI39_2618p0010 [Hamiltosporidium magnivora]TBU10326.1 hypothetical protein CWI38_1848p0030 [Hamiltosporidium tvaerminnensis]TBU12990.1 hypothetical protein CWI38_0564p0010 [Hamiltosporidium tvaerminnensis]